MSQPGPEPNPPQGLPPARPAPIDPRLQRPASKPAPASAPAPAGGKPPPAEQAPPPSAAPPATPPGVVGLFEAALAGLMGPGAFRALAARPAPPFLNSAVFVLMSGAAALAVAVTHAAVESPGLLARYSPPLIAAVGVAALGLYLSITLLFAVMLYGLGNALGGKGDFDRGLEAAAVLSVLWPVQMMCNWFAVAWVLPSAVAAWMGAAALDGLFGAKPWPARTACALLGAAALGVQTVLHLAVEKAVSATAAAQAIAQAAGAQAEMAQQLQAIAAQVQTLPAPAGGTGAAPSGLDLLRGSGGEEGGGAGTGPGTPEAQATQAAQGMQAGAIGMLDSMAPLLNNPAMTRNMTPQQKADMKELQTLMADLKGQLASGHSVSDAEFSAKMQRFQGLTMRMMAAAAAAQAAPPDAPQKTTPHLKLPEPGDRR